MSLTMQRNKLRAVRFGALLILGFFTVTALFSTLPLVESMFFVLAQGLLAFAALLIFFKNLPVAHSASGPGFICVFALHVLLYYGIANVVPCLFGEYRPAYFFLIDRIPQASVLSYAVASLAAMLLLAGMAIGDHFARLIWPISVRKLREVDTTKLYPWLPSYRLSKASCIVFLVVVCAGTLLYGYQFGTLMSDEKVKHFLFIEKLFFHGLFVFLPMSPFFATSAYVQSVAARHKRIALRLLIISSFLTVAALCVWRMRSTAILAIGMPVLLLCYTRVVAWRRAIVPTAVLCLAIYSLLTAVRVSDFTGVISRSGGSNIRYEEIISGLMRRGCEQSVLGYFWFDFSYRAAGLDGASALVEAQGTDRLGLKWGRVIQAGFLQSFPAALRPEFLYPERVKTAPSYYGIFREGDWITTILAEFILDFGPLFLFFPAIVAGFVLSAVDHTLLRLGVRSHLQVLLILRIPWLLTLIHKGSSVSDMAVLFFKSTFGYALILLLLGLLINVRSRRGRL